MHVAHASTGAENAMGVEMSFAMSIGWVCTPMGNCVAMGKQAAGGLASPEREKPNRATRHPPPFATIYTLTTICLAWHAQPHGRNGGSLHRAASRVCFGNGCLHGDLGFGLVREAQGPHPASLLRWSSPCSGRLGRLHWMSGEGALCPRGLHARPCWRVSRWRRRAPRLPG